MKTPIDRLEEAMAIDGTSGAIRDSIRGFLFALDGWLARPGGNSSIDLLVGSQEESLMYDLRSMGAKKSVVSMALKKFRSEISKILAKKGLKESLNEASPSIAHQKSFDFGSFDVDATVYADGRVVIKDDHGYVRWDSVKEAIRNENQKKIVKWLKSLDLEMGESAGSLIDNLEEAVWGLKGRNTDSRQLVPDIVSGSKSPYRGYSPGQWLIELPKDQYPGPSYMGPVALALVGHTAMSEDEFQTFLGDVHSTTYHRQTSEPAVPVEHGATIDLRRTVRGGDYDQGVYLHCPASHRMFTMLVTKIDDVNNHPLAQNALMLLRQEGPYTIEDLFGRIDRLASELDEPGYNKHTLGNVLNNISYPFGTGGIY